MHKVTVPHMYMDGYGIEITELETKHGAKTTYRFCRWVPGHEHPFSDFTEYQLEAMIEQWSAMKAERRRLQLESWRQNRKKTQGGLTPMRDIAESTIRSTRAAASSVDSVGQRYSANTQKAAVGVEVSDDDIPF